MTCESQSLKHFNQSFWARPRVVVLVSSEPRTVSEKVNYPSNVIQKKKKEVVCRLLLGNIIIFS